MSVTEFTLIFSIPAFICYLIFYHLESDIYTNKPVKWASVRLSPLYICLIFQAHTMYIPCVKELEIGSSWKHIIFSPANKDRFCYFNCSSARQ